MSADPSEKKMADILGQIPPVPALSPDAAARVAFAVERRTRRSMPKARWIFAALLLGPLAYALFGSGRRSDLTPTPSTVVSQPVSKVPSEVASEVPIVAPAPKKRAFPSKRGMPADSLAQESALLTTAFNHLRSGSPTEALVTLDAYRAQFPQGQLQTEAVLVRIQALVGTGDVPSALNDIDAALAQKNIKGPRARELPLLKAELLLRSGRLVEAVVEFERIGQRLPHGELEERAMSGRVNALLQLRRVAEAQEIAREYVQKYPGGRLGQGMQEVLSRSNE